MPCPAAEPAPMPHSSDGPCLCPDCLPLAAHWLATRELSLASSLLRAAVRASRAYRRVHDPDSEAGIRAHAAAARARRDARLAYTTAMATVRELAPHLAPTPASVLALAAWAAQDATTQPSTLPQEPPPWSE